MLLWCVLAAGGCGATDEAPASGGWRAAPPGPLSPRESVLGIWTGAEALFIGGSDNRPCPPTADCAAPGVPPLADGAAFDPRTGAWRLLAPAPVPFEWAQAVVIGTTAYVWAPGTPGRPRAARAFLAYDVDDDRWSTLPLPPTEPGSGYRIVRAGKRVVAYSGSDEHAERPDFVFEPATQSWSELPDDPLTPGFDRWMVETEDGLVLLDHELVPNPNAERPSLLRTAVLPLDTGAWRPLRGARILGSGPLVADGARVVAPGLGLHDGGETNNWGRSYRDGGVLDTRTGAWTELPGWTRSREEPVAGVISRSGAHYFGPQGLLLNVVTGEWAEVPPLARYADVMGHTVVTAGRDMLVFGGVRWPPYAEGGVLLSELWIWSP